MRRLAAYFLMMILLLFAWCFNLSALASDNNGLFVQPAGGNADISVEPGASAVLQVIASCDQGSLSYQWGESGGAILQGETSSTLRIEGNTNNHFFCRVSDEYGHSEHMGTVLLCLRKY